jgi:hypothetical protein
MAATKDLFNESLTLHESVADTAREKIAKQRDELDIAEEWFNNIEKNGLPKREPIDFSKPLEGLNQPLVYCFFYKPTDELAQFGETQNGNGRLRQHWKQIEKGKAASPFIKKLLELDANPSNWEVEIMRTPNHTAAKLLEEMLIDYAPTLFNSTGHGGL